MMIMAGGFHRLNTARLVETLLAHNIFFCVLQGELQIGRTALDNKGDALAHITHAM